MPKMSEPLSVTAPPAATAGKSIMLPLLSAAKCVTGFGTCMAFGTVVSVQVVAVAHAKYRPWVTVSQLPQSNSNGPMPRMPLAPKLATVSSAVPVPEQAAGTVVNRESPITWTGTDFAVSPAICTSARATGHQLKPSTNYAHWTRELPLARVSTGSVTVSTGAKRRSPYEPVYT